MQAFGLEESGSYSEAEAAGLAALAVNPDDVWAIHAVVHAHEMRGRVADGIRFLREREADWGSGNLFTVHNWWHLALFHLEGGDIDDTLGIYDAQVHHAESQGVPLEMVDASAMLWRLRLDGVSDGGRFAPLADAWATRTDGRPWYVFNDLHAVMALVGAGRIADAEGVVERLAGYVHCGGSGTNVAMTAEIVLPASRAIIRFAQSATPTSSTSSSHPSGPPAVRGLARPARRAPAHAARGRPAGGRLDLARSLLSSGSPCGRRACTAGPARRACSRPSGARPTRRRPPRSPRRPGRSPGRESGQHRGRNPPLRPGTILSIWAHPCYQTTWHPAGWRPRQPTANAVVGATGCAWRTWDPRPGANAASPAARPCAAVGSGGRHGGPRRRGAPPPRSPRRFPRGT